LRQLSIYLSQHYNFHEGYEDGRGGKEVTLPLQ